MSSTLVVSPHLTLLYACISLQFTLLQEELYIPFTIPHQEQPAWFTLHHQEQFVHEQVSSGHQQQRAHPTSHLHERWRRAGNHLLPPAYPCQLQQTTVSGSKIDTQCRPDTMLQFWSISVNNAGSVTHYFFRNNTPQRTLHGCMVSWPRLLLLLQSGGFAWRIRVQISCQISFTMFSWVVFPMTTLLLLWMSANSIDYLGWFLR